MGFVFAFGWNDDCYYTTILLVYYLWHLPELLCCLSAADLVPGTGFNRAQVQGVGYRVVRLGFGGTLLAPRAVGCLTPDVLYCNNALR